MCGGLGRGQKNDPPTKIIAHIVYIVFFFFFSNSRVVKLEKKELRLPFVICMTKEFVISFSHSVSVYLPLRLCASMPFDAVPLEVGGGMKRN